MFWRIAASLCKSRQRCAFAAIRRNVRRTLKLSYKIVTTFLFAVQCRRLSLAYQLHIEPIRSLNDVVLSDF